MSWCAAGQVAQLLATARVRHDVAPQTRKYADMAFLDLYHTAINIGDVLCEIATDADRYGTALCLNAVLALEPLFSRQGWCEGRCFSDKDAIRRALLAVYARHDAVGTAPLASKLHEATLRCLADVIVLECPDEDWLAFLYTCLLAVTGQPRERTQGQSPPQEASSRHACHLLYLVATAAHTNYALWHLLADDATRLMLDTLDTSSAVPRADMLRCFIALLERRPRPSAAGEALSGGGSTECVVLSPRMRNYVTTGLQSLVQQAAAMTASDSLTDVSAFFVDCVLFLQLAQRLLQEFATAREALQACLFFLANLRVPYAQCGAHEAAMQSLVEGAMDCLLGVLQTFPDLARHHAVADYVTTMQCYMADAANEDDVAVVDVMTGLAETLMEDEAVPLGCGGGSVAAQAAAVLELVLEARPSEIGSVVAILLDAVTALLQPSAAVVAFVVPVTPLCAARVLRVLARVAEAADGALVDRLDRTQATALMQVIGCLCRRCDARHAFGVAMLLEALSLCVTGTREAALRAGFVSSVTLVCDEWRAAASRELCGGEMTSAAQVVDVMCLAVLGRVVTEAGSQTSLAVTPCVLDEVCLRRCMETVCTASSVFAVFGAGTTLCAMLQAWPPYRTALGASSTCTGGSDAGEALVQSIVRGFCRQCRTRNVAALLARFLHLTSDPVNAQDGLPLLAATALATCCAADDHGLQRTLFSRSWSDWVREVGRRVLATQPYDAASVPVQLVVDSVPWLANVVQHEGWLDEGTSRSFATTFAIGACVLAVRRATTAAVEAMTAPLVDAHREVYAASETLILHAPHHCTANAMNVLCSSLAVQLIAQPALLRALTHGNLQSLLEHIFDDAHVEERRGMSMVGGCLLLAVLLICQPRTILSLAAQPASSRDAALWGRVMGWWGSLCVFVDRFTLDYCLLAWLRLLQASDGVTAHMSSTHCATAAMTANVSTTAATIVVFPCRLYHIASIYVKKLPTPLPQLSGQFAIVDVIAFALVTLQQRYNMTSKAKLVEPELATVLDISQRFASLAGESATADPLSSQDAREVQQLLSLCQTASEAKNNTLPSAAVDMLLAKLSQLGHDARIAAIQHALSAPSRQKATR